MKEMRVEVGMKESSKKKLVRSTWAGHVEKMGDEKLAKWRGNGGELEARKTETSMWDCIKSDKERVGE